MELSCTYCPNRKPSTSAHALRQHQLLYHREKVELSRVSMSSKKAAVKAVKKKGKAVKVDKVKQKKANKSKSIELGSEDSDDDDDEEDEENDSDKSIVAEDDEPSSGVPVYELIGGKSPHEKIQTEIKQKLRDVGMNDCGYNRMVSQFDVLLNMTDDRKLIQEKMIQMIEKDIRDGKIDNINELIKYEQMRYDSDYYRLQNNANDLKIHTDILNANIAHVPARPSQRAVDTELQALNTMAELQAEEIFAHYYLSSIRHKISLIHPERRKLRELHEIFTHYVKTAHERDYLHGQKTIQIMKPV